MTVNKIDKPSKNPIRVLNVNSNLQEVTSGGAETLPNHVGIFENNYLNDKDYSFISNDMSYAYKRDHSNDDNEHYPYTFSENLTRTEVKNENSGRRTIVLEGDRRKQNEEIRP